MSDTTFIQRRDRSTLEGGFDQLRREGITLSQQFSGKRWTDYNLHDPGVTILEQLCYAITDLIYRSGFDVADYLVNDQGKIAWDQQALFGPELIYPCRPTTIADYRKAILDAIPELENVWLYPVQNDHATAQGCYRMVLKARPGLNRQQVAGLKKQAKTVYMANRNLGEDLVEVRFAKGTDHRLCAEVEINEHQQPAEILAQIYDQAIESFARAITPTSFETAATEDHSLDLLFAGPMSERGHYHDSQLQARDDTFLVSSLYGVIKSIDGVDHVHHLYLKKGDQEFSDAVPPTGAEQAYTIVLPDATDEIEVVLTHNGRVVSVDIEEMLAKFEQISMGRRAPQSASAMLEQRFGLPKGVARALDQYSTIQEQFPAIYGVNSYGVPESASAQEKARVKQLKGYLVIFEQIMVNYLANLEGIKTLFSTNTDPANSYFSQSLTQQEIGGLDEILPPERMAMIEAIVAGAADYTDKKSRMLDYLLALYGEQLSSAKLRQFNHYEDRRDVEQVIVAQKGDYLKEVVTLGRDRAAAPNYSARSWAEWGRSGLQQRVSHQLGFYVHRPRSLTMAVVKQGLKIVPHAKSDWPAAEGQGLELIDNTRMEQVGFASVRRHEFATHDANQLRSLIEDTVPLRTTRLSDALLRQGVKIENFALGSLTDEANYQLSFRVEGDRYRYLGTYDNVEQGTIAANALRRFLIHLNQESEGLHVIEHLLLRPSDDANKPSGDDDDFYSFRVSVIFPDWTARCHDPQFRIMAEACVRENCPAHLWPDYYWFDFYTMAKFELLYKKWMVSRLAGDSSAQEVDEAALALTEFLQQRRGAR